MPNLIELAAQTLEFEKQLIESNGEISLGDPVEIIMADVQNKLSEKLDSYEMVMTRLKSRAEDYRKYSQQFAKSAQAMEKANERMRDKIKEAMQLMGKDEVNGNMFRYKLAQSNFSLVIDEDILPDEYKKTLISVVPDKEKIKEDLKNGIKIEGARLEPNVSLRSYGNIR